MITFLSIIFVCVLIISIILHEIAHGLVAYLFGDRTAKDAGRLTLNPAPHIDMLGSIILPVGMVLLGSSILFGWAKPVPYNPYNLKGRFAETAVASAGVLTNFLLAIIAAILYRFTVPYELDFLASILGIVIIVNLFLGILNLLPVPPLDGSKIISSLLPQHIRNKLRDNISQFINFNSIAFLILVLLFLVFFGIDYIASIVSYITTLLTGARLY